MAHGFLVHCKEDDVGVAVRDLAAGETVEGVFMDTGDGVTLTMISVVPLGHKVALQDMAEGHECREYNEVIGRVTAALWQGEHVHVHNIRSARWSR
jgi:(2R)-sulfolactate sulfo-lyase subunit alpha